MTLPTTSNSPPTPLRPSEVDVAIGRHGIYVILAGAAAGPFTQEQASELAESINAERLKPEAERQIVRLEDHL